MKNKFLVFVLVLAVVVTGIIFVTKSLNHNNASTKTVSGEAQMWTCGMHPTVVSDKPGKCPICGMDLIPKEMPVTAEKEKAQKPPVRKTLYYRNPMDARITSPSPMKDTMGMDYIPVYSDEVSGAQTQSTQATQETYYGCGVDKFGCCPSCDEKKEGAECICGGHKFVISSAGGGEKMVCPVCKHELKALPEEEAAKTAPEAIGSLTLNKTQVELSGIATIPVRKAKVFKEIRAAGKIAYDPELNVAQEEFIIALDTLEKVGQSPDNDVIERAKDLVEKSKVRLKISGMGDEQIKELEENRAVQRNLILSEDKAWVYADIYEYELGWIKEGLSATVTTQAYPGEEFKGVIKAISPILDPNTRTARVRLEIDNPQKKLKLEMFVDVFIEAALDEDVLVIAREAVLDTGARKIAWVALGGGSFSAREIKTGLEGVTEIDGQKVKVLSVLSGLSEGEYVVTKGNFLLDSQSQLTGGMSVLWGGASEIKEEGKEDAQPQEAPVATEHRH